MRSFFLAMMRFPEVQKQAQAEIDAVIGTDRLPTLADRDRLPYVNALVKEILRWNPVVPLGSLHAATHRRPLISPDFILGVPHRLTEDDVYGDYVLPKGTLVMANIWSVRPAGPADPDADRAPQAILPRRADVRAAHGVQP